MKTRKHSFVKIWNFSSTHQCIIPSSCGCQVTYEICITVLRCYIRINTQPIPGRLLLNKECSRNYFKNLCNLNTLQIKTFKINNFEQKLFTKNLQITLYYKWTSIYKKSNDYKFQYLILTGVLESNVWNL